jgi:hypothetical protein
MTDPQKPSQRLEYQASIDRPRLVLPDGGRVAVFLVVNIERWDIDRAMPRQALTAPQGAAVVPDLPNWAWHEYGMRVGFWRLKTALDRHGIAPPWRSMALCHRPTPQSRRPAARRGGNSWCTATTRWRRI